MPKSYACFRTVLTLLATLLLIAPGFAEAQDSTSSSAGRAPATSYDRLFLSFIEDATVVDRQWWEAQIEHSRADLVDSTLARGVVAFQPWNDIELGARLGFGSTSANSPNNIDGRGATDMDIWGKYYLGNPEADKVDLAVGVTLTVPTGDNSSGLGYDAFAAGFFGSLRWHISRMFTLSGNAGFQINEDGETLNSPPLDGRTAERLGVGVIAALSPRLNLVGEWAYAGERFDGTGTDSRLAASVNWRLGTNGVLRGSVVGGTSSGAPDTQILAGYAWQFP